MNVGECVQPGHGLTVTLTSVLPFAEYSVRKMTITCVSPIRYISQMDQFSEKHVCSLHVYVCALFWWVACVITKMVVCLLL